VTALSFTHFRREADFGDQRLLFSECFPENHGLPPETEPFYRRKFTAFPEDPPSYEYVARDETGLAGYYAALPFTYLVDGEPLRCGMVCDVMTAPRLRGKGVFTKLGAYSLGELQKAGVDFVSGYPRRPEVIPGHLKVGWKIAFKLPLFVLPLRADHLLRTRRVGFLAPLANPALALAHGALSLALPRAADVETHTWPWRTFLDKFDVDAFSERWQKGVTNALLKSRRYLEWRLSIQETEYHVVTAQVRGELVGLSILRPCQPEGVPSLALMDFMALEREPQVLAAMLGPWRELAARTGAETVLTMLSEHRAAQLKLWRFGFLRTPVDFSLILKCLSDKAQARISHDPAHWSLMWIDSDDL